MWCQNSFISGLCNCGKKEFLKKWILAFITILWCVKRWPIRVLSTVEQKGKVNMRVIISLTFHCSHHTVSQLVWKMFAGIKFKRNVNLQKSKIQYKNATLNTLCLDCFQLRICKLLHSVLYLHSPHYIFQILTVLN